MNEKSLNNNDRKNRAIYISGSVIAASYSPAQAPDGDKGGGGQSPRVQVSSVCHPGIQ